MYVYVEHIYSLTGRYYLKNMFRNYRNCQEINKESLFHCETDLFITPPVEGNIAERFPWVNKTIYFIDI